VFLINLVDVQFEFHTEADITRAGTNPFTIISTSTSH